MANARIQFSTATENRWTSVNPKLLEGEIAYVKTDADKYKMVIGGAGGTNYTESVIVWDQALAEQLNQEAVAAANLANNAATSISATIDQVSTMQVAVIAAKDEAVQAANNATTAASSAATETESRITSSMQGYVSAAQTASTTATEKANIANTAAINAASSADVASRNAAEAQAQANTASEKAESARTAESTATTKAAEASSSAASALSASGVATTKATEASASAITANEAKNTAVASASTATEKAGIATAKANEANASAIAAAQSAVDAQAIAGGNFIPNAEKATANGVASLDATGNVPAGQLGNIDLSEYALKTELPTKTSDLTNDSGYLTEVPLGEKYTEYVNADSFIENNVCSKTLTGSMTIGLPSSLGSGNSHTKTLILVNGGNYTITWGTIKWADGSAPTLTANGTDILTFITVNGGTTWYGVCANDFA